MGDADYYPEVSLSSAAAAAIRTTAVRKASLRHRVILL
jgi:hypothetical protein